MKKYRLCLIQPKDPRNKHIITNKSHPLSLLILANLAKENYSVRIINEQFDKINFKKYDLVGITLSTPIARRAYSISDRFRKLGVPVILGGPHVSVLPDEASLHADSIVVGEADRLWKKVLDDFEKKALKKRYIGSFVDLDETPVIRRYFNKNNYINYHIQTSRGCPHKCTFCISKNLFGSKIRHRKVSDVIDEIRQIKKRQRYFFFITFYDDNLFFDRRYVLHLVKELKRLKVKWGAFAQVSLGYDKELLKKLYESGCLFLTLGFESIVHESLKEAKKDIINNIDYYKRSISNIKSNNILCFGLFIFGFDGDTKRSCKDTLKFCLQSDLDHCFFLVLIPYPGSDIYKSMKRENRILDEDWYNYNDDVVFRPKNMAAYELKAIVKYCDNMYNSFFNIFKRLKSSTISWRYKLFFLIFLIQNRIRIKYRFSAR